MNSMIENRNDIRVHQLPEKECLGVGLREDHRPSQPVLGKLEHSTVAVQVLHVVEITVSGDQQR